MATIQGTGLAETLRGTNAADRIFGRGGDDTIRSLGGSDVVIGGAGADIISTGAGRDTIQYRSARESTEFSMDTVLDFGPLRDKFDVAALLGKQDLHWGYQSPTANGLWWVRSGADAFVYADLDGNADTIEFAVKLANFGTRKLMNTNFLGVENSAPTANADANFVREDIATVRHGRVLTNDTDPDAGTTLRIADPGTYQGTYGTLRLTANGGYRYTLDNELAAVQALNTGETLTDTFSYTATDGALTSESTLEITIIGVNEPV